MSWIWKKCMLMSTLGSRGYFFLFDTDGSRQSRVNEAALWNRTTTYFILGILKTDLWSQGRWCHITRRDWQMWIRRKVLVCFLHFIIFPPGGYPWEFGSLYVSGKLPTHPSPKPTFFPKWEVSVMVTPGNRTQNLPHRRLRFSFDLEKWFRLVFVICFIGQWMKRSKHGLFVFPPKKTLIWRRHCSIGQSCCSMTSKQSIDWFLESSSGMKFFQSSVRLTNQKQRAFVSVR